jgi:hypothetical protein
MEETEALTTWWAEPAIEAKFSAIKALFPLPSLAVASLLESVVRSLLMGKNSFGATVNMVFARALYLKVIDIHDSNLTGLIDVKRERIKDRMVARQFTSEVENLLRVPEILRLAVESNLEKWAERGIVTTSDDAIAAISMQLRRPHDDK